MADKSWNIYIKTLLEQDGLEMKKIMNEAAPDIFIKSKQQQCFHFIMDDVLQDSFEEAHSIKNSKCPSEHLEQRAGWFMD